MRGVYFGYKHSYMDFNMILTDVSISIPTPVRYEVNVPGADGKLDMTDLFTPNIKYKNRTIKLTFKYAGEFECWNVQESFIAAYLHGKRMHVILCEDEDYYWDAFCTIDSFKSDKRIGTLVINCDCYPYKYCVYENEYVVEGDGSVDCKGDRMNVIPTITTTDSADITFGDQTVSVNAGTHTITSFVFTEGINTLTIDSNGDTTITYRNGRL